MPELIDPYIYNRGDRAFIPNERLRDLIDRQSLQSEHLKLRCALSKSFYTPNTAAKIEGGSETKIVEPNLTILLDLMKDLYFHDEAFVKINSKLKLDKTLIAKSVQPEPCMMFSNDINEPLIILVTETIALESTTSMCITQLISILSSAVIGLRNANLSLNEAVVPGIAMSDDQIQFFAMFLIEENFPSFVALTRPLSLFSEIDIISSWCYKLSCFTKETIQLISNPKKPTNSTFKTNPTIEKLSLSLENYFLKPLRSNIIDNHDEQSNHFNAFTVNRFLRIYEIIRVNSSFDFSSLQELILFPSGLIAIPTKNCTESKEIRKLLLDNIVDERFSNLKASLRPVILFPLLDSSWKNEKPPKELYQSYLQQIRRGVDVLNEVKIIHLDLRPENILWKRKNEESNEVLIQIIDFEFAHEFGDIIPQDWVSTFTEYRSFRYPFCDQDVSRDVIACDKHNEFFYQAISEWLPSKFNIFFDFMLDNKQGEKVFSKVFNN